MISSQIKFNQLRALVVGENQFARSLTRAMLHNIDIERVFEARSGAAAIDELSSRNLDFMLLDWRMEDVSGAGVLQIMRNPNFGRNHDLPTIVLADNVSRRMIERVRNCGGQTIAALPLSGNMLQEAISKVLNDKDRTHKVTENEWDADRVMPVEKPRKSTKPRAPYADDIVEDAMDQFFIL